MSLKEVFKKKSNTQQPKQVVKQQHYHTTHHQGRDLVYYVKAQAGRFI